MSTSVLGAGLGAAVCVAAAPYLARLTLTVPDADATHWWRGRAAQPRRTLATALIGAVLGALAGAAGGASAVLTALVALAVLGTPLVVIDFEHHRLPDRLVYPAYGAVALLLVVPAATRSDWHAYLRAVEGGAAVFAVLFVIWFIAPRSFGFGDVKLGGVLGACLGWFGWVQVYFGIFGGFVLGSVVGIALLVSGRADRKTPVPFGPMLILGALIVLAFDLAPTHLYS